MAPGLAGECENEPFAPTLQVMMGRSRGAGLGLRMLREGGSVGEDRLAQLCLLLSACPQWCDVGLETLIRLTCHLEVFPDV